MRRFAPCDAAILSSCSTFAPVLALALACAGCGGRTPASLADPNLLPRVQLTAAPVPGSTTGFVVRLSWSAFDPDGQVVRFVYAVDPPAQGDTTWTNTVDHQVTLTLPATVPPDPLSPPGQFVVTTDAHTFVIRAVDNEGAASPVVTRSFTSRTVAPQTTILTPSPNREVPVSTLSQVTITWTGDDPDGVTRRTPVVYKYKLVPLRAIDPAATFMPGSAQVQAFFGADHANGFATWDSIATTPASFQIKGLTAGTVYVFAVVARDEAGAYEARFLLDSNVLAFKPSQSTLGPAITLANQFFSQTQRAGGISTSPDRIADMECPPGVVLHCHWSSTPTQGTNLAGFRWAIDLPDGSVTNEDPRADDSDIHHWSTWSIDETQAAMGPYNGSVDTTASHFLYVEAMDQIGFVSLFTLRVRIIVGRFDKSLLVIDDMYGQLASNVSTYPYPTEAEQDTFHFAVGGFPDALVGGISRPGAFAGFAYDTLDYQFSGLRGISLAALGRYKVIAWYTDNFSSGAGGDLQFGTNRPADAIRYINTQGRLNTLAAYLAQGGKVFLFGDGIAPSIANGFFSTATTSGVPFVPYSTNPTPSRNYVLRPGCFLYDFLHFQSELTTAGKGATDPFTRNEQLLGAIPYLPEFAGPATQSDRSFDPRIGPAAARTAARWEGLPRFTMANWRGANADPAQRSISQTWYVSKPLFVTEGQGPATVSVLDTLYLLQARDYSLDPTGAISDGKPNAFDYHGRDNGEIVWFGFPLYYFELDQARQAVSTVLRVLGVPPRAPEAAPVARARTASTRPASTRSTR